MPQFFWSSECIDEMDVKSLWGHACCLMGIIMKKLLMVTLLMFGAAQVFADPAIEAKYTKTCAICHAAGVAGAPKSGVVADWESRLAKGDEALLKSMNKGLNAMPPKGMCMDCSNEEFLALIKYMSTAK
jgi:cytochrome c5